MPTYILSLISSASVSAVLCGALVFLARNWIGERLKRAIGAEYDSKLEVHKAQLQASNAERLGTLTIMAVTTKKSVARSLGEAKDLAQYLSAIHGELDGQLGALFRGHRNSDWELVPAIARQTQKSTLERETAMLSEFRRRSLPYLESHFDLSDVDWLAIAQHHGMPTRLLDWSGSALAALWFAVNEPADDNTASTKKAAARVWMLMYNEDEVARDEERADPFQVERTVLVRPRHVTRRITAQDGWFTLHRGRYGDKSARAFVPLDKNIKFKDRLSYVTIPSDAFGAMRLQLATSGVTSATLFPDFAGVANYVTWSNFYPADEIVPRIQWLL